MTKLEELKARLERSITAKGKAKDRMEAVGKTVAEAQAKAMRWAEVRDKSKVVADDEYWAWQRVVEGLQIEIEALEELGV